MQMRAAPSEEGISSSRDSREKGEVERKRGKEGRKEVGKGQGVSKERGTKKGQEGEEKEECQDEERGGRMKEATTA